MNWGLYTRNLRWWRPRSRPKLGNRQHMWMLSRPYLFFLRLLMFPACTQKYPTCTHDYPMCHDYMKRLTNSYNVPWLYVCVEEGGKGDKILTILNITQTWITVCSCFGSVFALRRLPPDMLSPEDQTWRQESSSAMCRLMGLTLVLMDLYYRLTALYWHC